MQFHADLVVLLFIVLVYYPCSDGKLEGHSRPQHGVSKKIDVLIDYILSNNYDNVDPGHGSKKTIVVPKDRIVSRDTRDDDTSSGITLNSDAIRPALSLEDRADLIRIKSHLHAIKSQLDDIKLAPRARVTLGERPKEKISPAERKILQSGKSPGEIGAERPLKNVVSKKVIHHGKKLDKTKQHEEKVPNPSKNGQPVLDETSEKKYKKVLFENDSDKGANYNRMPEENQQQISSRQANHHITPINRTPEQIQGKRRSSGVDYSESVDETASSNDFYPEVKKNVRAIPTPGAFFGSSPTVGQTMIQEESPLSTLEPPEGSSSHNVNVREVSNSTVAPSLKKYIAESFIKAFDILKVSLVKIDTDLEQGLRQVYNLDTDHYNMATGDIRANGDKIERLQKYISNEMNLVKDKVSNLTSDVTLLTQNIQKTVDRLVNMTESLLNMTRTINDRTERINEIKERELKALLAKGNTRRHHSNAACHKHHHSNKEHSQITMKLGKQLRKHGRKLKHPLYHSLMNYLQRQHILPHKKSKQSLINTLATFSNVTSPLIHKKLKNGHNIWKSVHRQRGSHVPKQKSSVTKRETAEEKESRIKLGKELDSEEDSMLDNILKDDIDIN